MLREHLRNEVEVDSKDEAFKQANRIGYPVHIRVVTDGPRLKEAEHDASDRAQLLHVLTEAYREEPPPMVYLSPIYSPQN